METRFCQAESSDPELTWRHLDKHRLFAWQFLVFMGIRLTLYPATLIKTHLQARPTSSSSLLGAFSLIYHTRGICGFWSGFPSLAVGIIPSQIIYMSVYESVREKIPLKDPVRSGVAGASASLASQIVMVPVDVVSQTIQLNRGNAFATVKQILSSEGPKGLYKGFTTSAALYIPFSALWWSTYATSRALLYRYIDRPFPAPSSRFPVIDLLLSGSCGVVAASVAVIATAPLDLIKTLKQTTLRNKSSIEIVRAQKTIYTLWRGSGARLLSALPYSVAGITGYEFIKRMATRDQ